MAACRRFPVHLFHLPGNGQQVFCVRILPQGEQCPVEEAVDEVMDGFEGEDEVVVLTDLMVGSVNQKFFKYRTRPHTHIVSGMNLPLAFQIAMEPQGKYITEERMKEIIETAKEELKYVNEVSNDEDEEDE